MNTLTKWNKPYFGCGNTDGVCRNNATSDASLQVCNDEDNFQKWRYDAGSKMLKSEHGHCLNIHTSTASATCEPLTLSACDPESASQKFTQEIYDSSIIWRGNNGLALDATDDLNTVDNFISACPGSAAKNKFDSLALVVKPTVHLKFATSGGSGLCLSMKSTNAAVGCSHSGGCKANTLSDAVLQACDSSDVYQAFKYDTGTKQFKSNYFGCLALGTSAADANCEPVTLKTCDATDVLQQFTKEEYSGSTMWRGANSMALDVTGSSNVAENTIKACTGVGDGAKKVEAVMIAAG